MAQHRIESVDALRGCAALAVAWFHFTKTYAEFPISPILNMTGKYGYLGVEVFFVISGFIIPFALSRSDYRIKYFGRFVLKRILRLDPPYLVTIAMIILLNYVTNSVPGFGRIPYRFSFAQLLLHLGYVNAFFGYRWLNSVFWTLAIEFQYYLMMGLLFPLFNSKKALIRYAAFAALGLLAVTIKSHSLIFHYLFLFMLGIWTFQMHVGIIQRQLYLPGVLVIGLGVFLTLGTAITIAGVTAVLVIAYVRFNARILTFLGAISYSLYLLHLPIGGLIINLYRWSSNSFWRQLLIRTIALGISLIAAYLLHRYVELPSQVWSARVAYTPRKSHSQLIDRESL